MVQALSQGTSVTQTIYTNQANNEEVRVYGIMVEVMAGSVVVVLSEVQMASMLLL